MRHPFLLLLAIAPAALSAQSLDTRSWQGDVDILMRAVDSIHPAPYHVVSRDSMLRAAAAFRAELPRLDATRAVAGFARLMAQLHDGHSRLGHVQLPNHSRPVLTPLAVPGFDRIYPVEFEFFSDGLHVVAAGGPAEQLLGGHVVTLAGRPASEVGAALEQFIAHDNSQWIFYTLPAYLRHPGYLYAAGILDSPLAALEITIERDGRRTTVSMAPAPPDSVAWTDARARLGGQVPMWESITANYSLRAVAPGVLYLRYRQVQNDSSVTIAQFADTLTSRVDAERAHRVIIDIRHNGGGNGYLNQPLVHALIRHPRLRDPGSVVVITDRGTFSAAIMLARAIEDNLFAAFVGEPVSSPANHPGDPARLTLPGSGLLVRISSLYWQLSDMRDRRPAIVPDVPVGPGFTDWLRGRDPVLAAAIALDAGAIEWPRQPNMNWGRAAQDEARYQSAVRW